MIESIFFSRLDGELLLEKRYQGIDQRKIFQDFTKQTTIKTINQQEPFMVISDHVVIYIQHEDVLLIAILSMEQNIINCFCILQQIIDSCVQVFQKFNSDIIRQNYSQIIIMLEDYLDYGIPSVAQNYVLDRLMTPESFFERLSVQFANEKTVNSLQNYLSQQLSNEALTEYPWRPRSMKYTVNSVYLDLVEYLNICYDRMGNQQNMFIEGDLVVTSELSGTPELSVSLQTPVKFDFYSFHPCALAKKIKFDQQKQINFVPPDGKFVLMSYGTRTAQSVTVPFNIQRTLNKRHGNKYDFQVTVSPKVVAVETKKFTFEDFSLTFQFPLPIVSQTLSVDFGAFSFDEQTGIAH